jgi:hypothetical protein
MAEEWTRDQCAKEWKVEPDTWSGYVTRGQAPKPTRHIGRTPLWDADEVRGWQRPGQGARRRCNANVGGESVDLVGPGGTSVGSTTAAGWFCDEPGEYVGSGMVRCELHKEEDARRDRDAMRRKQELEDWPLPEG